MCFCFTIRKGKKPSIENLTSKCFKHNISSYTSSTGATTWSNLTDEGWLLRTVMFQWMIAPSTDLRPVQDGCAEYPWSYSWNSFPSRDGRAAETGVHWREAPGHLSRTEPIWGERTTTEHTHLVVHMRSHMTVCTLKASKLEKRNPKKFEHGLFNSVT